MTRYLFMPFFIGFVVSCSTSTKVAKLDPESYVKWCYSPEFSWKNSDTLNGIAYSVRFVPGEYDIAACALKHCETKESLINDLNSKNNFYSFFLDFVCEDFSRDLFSYPGKTGMNAADRKIYLNNHIKKDIVGITTSNDTISCVSTIYEVNISNRARVIFELEDTEKTLTKIILKDKMINNAVIEFSITELSKKKIPTLNLKNYE
jgi:hypothetical protein